MAAILCKPIGSCFEFICTAPCKACASLSCTNPLSAFVGITFLTQLPIAVVSALELGHLGSCRGSQWLIGMLVVAIAHMVTSVYLSHRVTNSTDEKLRHKHTAWERISYMLCHDPWIALYLLVVVFSVAWLCIGSAWSINGTFRDDIDACGTNVPNRIATALGLGWFFLFAGPMILSCNLCCACCLNKTDYAGDDAAFAAKAAAKENTTTKTNNNSNADIETPHNPPSRGETKPPRAYSAGGVPITTTSDNIQHAEAVVIGEIPPPMMPPQSKKGGEHGNAKQLPDTKASIY